MAIATIYFPQLDSQLIELEVTSQRYLLWMSEQGMKRLIGKLGGVSEGLAEAFLPVHRKSVEVIEALRAIGSAEFHASRLNKKVDQEPTT